MIVDLRFLYSRIANPVERGNVKRLFILLLFISNYVNCQNINPFILKGLDFYKNIGNYAYQTKDTLELFEHNFLICKEKDEDLYFLIPNIYDPKRDYSFVDGIFVEKDKIFFFLKFKHLQTNEEKSLLENSFILNVFFEDTIYSLLFIESRILSISQFTKNRVKTWVEKIYIKNGDCDLSIENLTFDNINTISKNELLLKKYFEKISFGERSKEEVYYHLF